MGLVDWRIVVAVGVVGLLVLLIGLRGKRADLLPRCKRRRCRYDLSAFIGGVKPGDGYPVTCPECGRAAQGEREVKWGRRKARRRVAWFGAVVLALSAMVGGVEVYARATNANTLAWMPLWLIMERAEKDTFDNQMVHQRELLRRVDAEEIKGEAARRLIARLLEWQTDESLFWGRLGDVFATLAMQGYATEVEIKWFWANVWILSMQTRDAAVEGEWVPIEVHGDWRGHQSRAIALSGPEPFALPMIGTQQFDAADFRFFGEATIVVGDRAPSVRSWRRFGVGRSNQAWFTFNVQVWSLGHGGIFRQPQVDPTRVFVAAHPGEETVVTLKGEILPVDEGFMQSASRTVSYYNSEDADNISELRTLLEKNGYRTSWPVQASRMIRVVEDTNSGVVFRESDAMKAALNEVIRASFREMTMSGGLAHMSVGLAPVWNAQGKERLETLREFNLAVAHRVYLRLPGGEEVRTEGFVLDDHGAPWGVVPIDPATMGGYFQDDDSFPVVVLRPDPTVARSAVGIKNVWNGVLEIPITEIERKNLNDEMRRMAAEAKAEATETEKIKALTPAPAPAP